MKSMQRSLRWPVVVVSTCYAIDTSLDLPATATRDDLMKAIDGHVIGKAAHVGRVHATPQEPCA